MRNEEPSRRIFERVPKESGRGPIQKRLVIAVAVLVFALLLVVFAQSGGAANQSSGFYTTEQAKSGKTLFETNCAVCHGDQLQGGGGGPALTGENFVKDWEQSGKGTTAGDLYGFISTQMPLTNPGGLEGEQYVDILAFILQQNDFPAGKTPLPSKYSELKKIKLTPPK